MSSSTSPASAAPELDATRRWLCLGGGVLAIAAIAPTLFLALSAANCGRSCESDSVSVLAGALGLVATISFSVGGVVALAAAGAGSRRLALSALAVGGAAVLAIVAGAVLLGVNHD